MLGRSPNGWSRSAAGVPGSSRADSFSPQELHTRQHIEDPLFQRPRRPLDAEAKPQSADARLRQILGQGGIDAVGWTVEAAVGAAHHEDSARSR